MATKPPKGYSKPTADRACEFFETYLVHSKGEWAGQKFKLAPWQEKDIIRPLFGTLLPDGLRQYRQALIGVPRKNGKSFLGAGIALKLLFADSEPGAEVYSAAADREQARIVFEMARTMVEANPKLSARAKVYRNSIVVPSTNSVYKVISAEAYSKHGLSPHGVVLDELHAQPNRELYDVLTTGQGARRQPLTVAITTAGFDRDTICWQLYDYGKKIKAGVLTDPTFFFRWWAADETKPWNDESTWIDANPNIDVSISRDFLRSEARQAKQLPARQTTFIRLYTNVWTQSETRWIDLDVWDRTAGLVTETKLEGRVCCGGLDLASTTDIAALCWDFPDGDEHDAIWRFFIARDQLDSLDKRTAGQAAVWAREGFLTVNEGAVIDYDAIRQTINRDSRTFDVRRLAFDRWGSAQIVQQLQEDGIPVAEMGQGFASMSGPSKELERLVLDGKYRHGGNPVMRWMIDNVVVRQDPAGNIKVDKARSTEKVDGVVAAVMALDTSIKLEPKRTSIYEARGIEVV